MSTAWSVCRPRQFSMCLWGRSGVRSAEGPRRGRQGLGSQRNRGANPIRVRRRLGRACQAGFGGCDIDNPQTPPGRLGRVTAHTSSVDLTFPSVASKGQEVTAHPGAPGPEKWPPPSPDVACLPHPPGPAICRHVQPEPGRRQGGGRAAVTRHAGRPWDRAFLQGPCRAARHAGICCGRGPGGRLGVRLQGQRLLLEARGHRQLT